MKPSVDGQVAVRCLHDLRLDVATDSGLPLEQPDLVLFAQRVCGTQSTHSRPDDRDLHDSRPPAAARSSSATRMPFAASRPMPSKTRPRNGWTKRRHPRRRMSAMYSIRVPLPTRSKRISSTASTPDPEPTSTNPSRSFELSHAILHRGNVSAHPDLEVVSGPDGESPGADLAGSHDTRVPDLGVGEIADERERVVDRQHGVDPFMHARHGCLQGSWVMLWGWTSAHARSSTAASN